MTISSGPISSAAIGADATGAVPPEVVDIALPLRIRVVEDALLLTRPLRIRVVEPITPALALQISVGAVQPELALPLRIRVVEPIIPMLAVSIQVIAADAFAVGGRWRPVVVLDGVDISSRLTGQLVIDGNEGEARIADVVLRPLSGAINLASWTGKTITIDYARRQPDGSALYPHRLFTGLVDQPEYDPVTRLTHLRCTDDLQGVCAALPRATLDALIGGYWHGAVFDAAADGWQYAKDRASTQPGALDCDPYGGLRLTSWEAKASADLIFSAGSLLDGSLAVTLAQKAAIRNDIEVEFRYRFPRLKKRVVVVGYTYPFDLSQILINGYTIPTRKMIGDAIHSAGWEVNGAIGWVPCPEGPLSVNLGGATMGVWAVTKEVAQDLCFGFTAGIRKRYTQSVDEVYRCAVRNAASIAAIGSQTDRIEGALEAAFDASGWEATHAAQVPEGSMYEGEGPAEPEPALPDIAAGEIALDYPGAAEVDDHAAAAAAVQTLIAQAQVRIWASHRGTRVRFTAPLHPLLDLDRTVAVATGNVSAKGKLAVVRHVMDLDAGRAVSEAEIAICALSGVGIVHPHSTPTAPAAPAGAVAGEQPSHVASTHVGSAWYSAALNESMLGYFTNVSAASSDYSASAPVYPVQFSFQAPAIDDASRDNAEIEVAAEYQARIVEDQFAVSV